MKILGYKGKSWVSKAIQWQTRSPYSHVAVMDHDNSVFEAWHKGGVRHIPHPKFDHDPSTVIDVFDIAATFSESEVRRFLLSQIGKDYDFKSVARFVSRRKVTLDEAWFCSEYIEYAFEYGHLTLLNGNKSEHSPRDTLMSPYLVHVDTL